jgi:anion-transporting  ArsA/GET3 family ATPase
MSSDDLLSKRLVFFTGKGGVGKSALSAALGLIHARAGRRVLMVEMNARSRMAPLFDVPHVGYDPVQLEPNLFAMNITPREALEEYMHIVFKLRFIAERVIKNNLFKVFTAALPGMDDLVSIGKIWYLDRERFRGRPRWDRIIVDAPATGHGITFLRLPQVTIDTVRVGPIARSAEQIRDMVLDAENTSVNLVTLAEELPVNETIDLYKSLEDLVGVPFGRVFVNAVYPHLFDGELATFIEEADAEKAIPSAGAWAEGLLQAARTQMLRERLNRRHIDRLRENVPEPSVELPYIFTERFGKEAIEQLAESLRAGLENEGS